MCQPRDDLTGGEAAEAHLDKENQVWSALRYTDGKEKAVSNNPETARCDHGHADLTTARSPITGFAGPRRAIIPYDSIAANVAPQTVPIPSKNIATAANFQPRRLAILVSGYKSPPRPIYFGSPRGVAV